jgi:hypothetical protein
MPFRYWDIEILQQLNYLLFIRLHLLLENCHYYLIYFFDRLVDCIFT